MKYYFQRQESLFTQMFWDGKCDEFEIQTLIVLSKLESIDGSTKMKKEVTFICILDNY